MCQVLALFLEMNKYSAFLWSEFSLVMLELELDNGRSLCTRNVCRLDGNYTHFCKAILRKANCEKENSAQVTDQLGACSLEG